MRRSALGLFALAAVAVGGWGCSSYRYYDVTVNFSGFTGVATTSKIQIGHVYVTGAETNDFYLCDPSTTCPFNSANPSTWGVFEYSSLADSGTLTFDMKVFNTAPEGPSCQIGEGTTNVTIDATVTNPVTLTVMGAGTGC